MSKVVTLAEVVDQFKDGMTIMVGGFMTVGTPELIIDALVEKGVRDLTLICNDGGLPGQGVGKLIGAHRVKRLIASHVGLNPEVGRQMNSGEMQVDLVPQGTLAERIRAGGAGLGGFLTPTGVGTVIEEGKQTMVLEGRTYLLELPLKADFAFVKAHKADTMGNLVYRRSTRNFNPPMAMAAETVIAQVFEVVQAGDIDPDAVMTPGIFVDYVVKA